MRKPIIIIINIAVFIATFNSNCYSKMNVSINVNGIVGNINKYKYVEE
jgi:hypothetical protein